MKNTQFEIRNASHPDDTKSYDTTRLRKEFLIEKIFIPDMIMLYYSDYDRFIIGGIFPAAKTLKLETIVPLKSEHFLDRREMGLINIGGKALISVDGASYIVNFKEAMYIGKDTKEVAFESVDKSNPAKLYLNSAPAHKEYPVKHVTLNKAIVQEMGNPESSNHRKINKLLVSGVVDTNQLQMGMTEFLPGSIWNTMPPHTHGRRMEAYFYFEVPEKQAVCHFMGQPDETRHIWLQNEQAVISPSWSIHAGAGTAKYTFIWGMAGENLDYGDIDTVQPSDLR
ncbi:MAG: 5-dehydro-4-deoxy-D-glucuronate isomerase [Bacteroidales bacterium]|nr:5-dehydro-4-deoxy-D-glucuronate isomerase [Bacteroidales bacterium]